MQRDRGIEIFVFHDDNFFIPNHGKSLERCNALADAIEARGARATSRPWCKARPTDVTPAVFQVLVDRLRCIRCYVGVETDADQGLITLRRWAQIAARTTAPSTSRASWASSSASTS